MRSNAPSATFSTLDVLGYCLTLSVTLRALRLWCATKRSRRIAIEEAKKYEISRGWEVESVEADNRGFDLISRKPHPHDPKTFTDVRFIEVKGRVVIGEVALSFNEYRTAERLKRDYWLYAVFNCGSKPELHPVQDPARLGWEPIVKIDHYHTSAEADHWR